MQSPTTPTTAQSAGTQLPTVSVNGAAHSLADTAPYLSLLDWLRDLGLTGAKEGCAEGECGACSVLVARPGVEAATEWTPLNACLVPAWAVAGGEVVTAEGLSEGDALHPVQREMALRGGSQCGYCTPGFICSMAGEFYRPSRTTGAGTNGADGHSADGTAAAASAAVTDLATPGGPTAAASPDAEPGGAGSHECGPNGFDLHSLSGNLCRCTGYRPIADAAYALGTPEEGDALRRRMDAPPPAGTPAIVTVGDQHLVRPADLAEALDALAEYPDAQLVAGSTDWGVEVNIRSRRVPTTILIDRLPELRGYDLGADEIRLGAALTLTEIERRLAGAVPLLDELFPQFASRLIRNGATLGGNLGTGSPIGDAPPVLLALDADLELVSVRGRRRVPLADYFTGYRQSVRAADELISAVLIPRPLAPVTAFHKIAKRRFDDISSVAVAFALEIADGVVRRARIGAGGVAATPIRATATENALVGAPWQRETVQRAAEILGSEGTPMSDHRASAKYRAAMLAQSLLKLYAQTQQEVGA